MKIDLGIVDKTKLRVTFADTYKKIVELRESELFLINVVGIENLIAEVVERTARESGEIYQCVEVKITESCSKTVYLDKAEKEIIAFLSD